eukprot:501533-Prymnesium_polylepis.1
MSNRPCSRDSTTPRAAALGGGSSTVRLCRPRPERCSTRARRPRRCYRCSIGRARHGASTSAARTAAPVPVGLAL